MDLRVNGLLHAIRARDVFLGNAEYSTVSVYRKSGRLCPSKAADDHGGRRSRRRDLHPLPPPFCRSPIRLAHLLGEHRRKRLQQHSMARIHLNRLDDGREKGPGQSERVEPGCKRDEHASGSVVGGVPCQRFETRRTSHRLFHRVFDVCVGVCDYFGNRDSVSLGRNERKSEGTVETRFLHQLPLATNPLRLVFHLCSTWPSRTLIPSFANHVFVGDGSGSDDTACTRFLDPADVGERPHVLRNRGDARVCVTSLVGRAESEEDVGCAWVCWGSRCFVGRRWTLPIRAVGSVYRRLMWVSLSLTAFFLRC